MKTSEIIAKLKSMAAKAGESLFERTTLAAKALADKEWIDAEFSGDYDAALLTLEADCFPDFFKTFTLRNLLELLKSFPTAAEWREHKFSLPRLWAEHERLQEAQRGDKPVRDVVRVKKADVEQRDEKIKELDWAIKQAREAIQSKESELDRLRRENEELRVQVKALEITLERIRKDRLQPVS